MYFDDHKIIRVAIKFPDEGVILMMDEPNRHNHIIAKAKELNLPMKYAVQGFMTDHDMFVDRHRAFQIAHEAHQVGQKCTKYGELYSEDLW